MISLRQIAQCVGLSGDFSVIRGFYGYRSSPNSPPIQLSLIQQTRLLRDGQHIRVHIKIITNTTTFSIDQMIDGMRQVYGNYGIGVVIRSIENLNLPSDFLDIDVGQCRGSNTTKEQKQLFDNRNFVGANEVVVYFVRSTNPPFSGCATHPNNRPGAIVVRTASQWTLAHELGHVLDLLHAESGTCPNSLNPPQPALCLSNRLMTCCGTSNITNPPPNLVNQEVQEMLNSNLTLKC